MTIGCSRLEPFLTEAWLARNVCKGAMLKLRSKAPKQNKSHCTVLSQGNSFLQSLEHFFLLAWSFKQNIPLFSTSFNRFPFNDLLLPTEMDC